MAILDKAKQLYYKIKYRNAIKNVIKELDRKEKENSVDNYLTIVKLLTILLKKE